MKLLKDRFEELGAEIIGDYMDEGYEFSDSEAFDGEKFIGLALDEVNQSEISDGRIEKWLDKII
jgi:flavodoxin I